MTTTDEQQDDNNRLYTAEEAASILRVGRRKIMQMGTAGEIEMIKLGTKTFRFTARSVQKLLKPKKVAR
jgi:excisionase family DNA binding protein